MKQYLISIVIIVASLVWFHDWVISGKMDNFIQNHRDPGITPKVLLGLSQISRLAQMPQAASHYYRWIIEEYPEHEDIPKIRFELAQCYEELHRRDLAKEQFLILKDSFTHTDYGKSATQRYYQNYQ